MSEHALIHQRLAPKSPGYPVLGTLEAAGLHLHTLEDPYMLGNVSAGVYTPVQWPYTGIKIPGVTAIPEGRYRVRLSMSTRFREVLPALEDVPQFTGIRVHALNWQEGTEGCIGVGLSTDGMRSIFESQKAVQRLVAWLKERELDRVWWEVRNP